MSRTYKINEQTLSSYMDANHLASQAIVGESADSFILKTGKSGMRPLAKSDVESWAISQGMVEGLGMKQNDRTIFEASKRKSSSEIADKKAQSKAASNDNLDAYKRQTKEYRASQAQQQAFSDNTEEVSSKHFGTYQSKKGR